MGPQGSALEASVAGIPTAAAANGFQELCSSSIVGIRAIVERRENTVNGDNTVVFREAGNRQATPSFRLEDSDVHLWSATLDHFFYHNHEFSRMLTLDELLESQMTQSEEERQRLIAGRGMLRYILSCYLATEPRSILLGCSRGGTPRFVQHAGNGILFDMSTAEAEALYVVALNRPVGVDVEIVRPVDEDVIAAAESLTEPERKIVRSLKAADRSVAFFRFLARKEALVKARGGSLAMAAAASADAATSVPGSLPCEVESGRWAVGGWTVEDVAVIEGYASAVAAKDHDWRIRAIYVKTG